MKLKYMIVIVHDLKRVNGVSVLSSLHCIESVKNSNLYNISWVRDACYNH